MTLAALPLPLELALASLGGLAAGALVNWAVYGLAWNRRPISPWSLPDPDAPARQASDRIPLWGWLGLRREATIHGPRFWVRPLLVELAMAAGWAALYWWEVGRQGLIAKQFEALAGGPLPAGVLQAPTWTTLATFISHAILITLMAAASLIDIDEKTIPDGITVPGTLVALVLAAVMPMSLLPHVSVRALPPAVGAAVPMPANAQLGRERLYVEPLTPTTPNEWPSRLNGAPNWLSLIIGLACYTVWCFALTPRIWRRRRGAFLGLGVMLSRVVRELTRPPLAWIAIVGAAAIAAAWFRGGAMWVGLLTSLIGLVGGSAMVWAVRIVSSKALHKEALGFGDVTLMMMIGAFLGWQPAIFIFFIAPLAALIIGIAQLLLGRGDVIPYGPFLCLATLLVVVRWADFWNADEGGFQALFYLGWLVPLVLALGVVMLGAMLVIWRNIKESIFHYETD